VNDMTIQLWSDAKTFSLPLMKLAAFHRTRGDSVERYDKGRPCDIIYCSKIFSAEFTPDVESAAHAGAIIKGGTGYPNTDNLPYDVEHITPAYDLYGLKEAVGFLSRGCPHACGYCCISRKEGLISKQVADLSEFWTGQRRITLYDPNILACGERERLFSQLAVSNATVLFEQGLDARLIDSDAIGLIKSIKTGEMLFAWDLEKNSGQITRGLLAFKAAFPEKRPRDLKVYVLVNYDTDFKFDIYRVEWLKANGFNPYVMIFNKIGCHTKYRRLQRYANNKYVFWKTDIQNYYYLKDYL